MVGFIFGGNTGETAGSLKRKRETIEALQKQIMGGQPKNVYEGIAAVMKGAATGIGKYRLDKAEKDGAADFTNNVFNPLMRGSPFVPAAVGNAMPKLDDAGNIPATSSTFAPVDIAGGDVFTPFMETVKTGVQNPFALAAIAATGNAESKFSPGNVNRTWSDPSESGQAGTAGGIMSWRGPRYQALAKTGDLSPAGQAKFFLKENPQLIEALNKAGSVEEAQGLMNNAWKFAGYDRPGGEAASRLAAANAYLPKFQGQSTTEVASLDPSIGMTPMPVEQGAALPDPAQPQTAAAAIEAISPTQHAGSLSDEVAAFQQTPEYASQFPGRAPASSQARMESPFIPPEFRGSKQIMGATDGIIPALTGGRPAAEQQVAQAQQASQQQPAPQQEQQQPQGANALGLDPRLIAALSNPFVAPEQKAVLQAMAEQQMQEAAAARERSIKASDPSTQLEMDYKRAQIEALKAKGDKQSLINAGEGRLYDPNSGSWISAPDPAQEEGKFRFKGTSVEAQSLNGLMDSNAITPEQAQQLGAGKTITGPNGEIMFLTPNGVFSQQGNGVQPQTGRNVGNAQPQTQAQPNQGQQSATIPLTQPKVTIDEKKAMTFADRMKQSGLVIDQHGAAGQGIVDTIASKIPYAGNYMVSDEFQNLDQARRNFINAQLRRESGAVISNEEFDNANKQYFPQPGDNKETIELKRRNRQTVIEGMARDGGPTYGADKTVDPLGIR